MNVARIVLNLILVIAIISAIIANGTTKTKNVIYTGKASKSCNTKTYAKTTITGDIKVYYSTEANSSNCTLAYTKADE